MDNTRQVARVVAACVRAAQTALKHMFPARMGWGHVNLPGLPKTRFQHRMDPGDVDLADGRLDFLKVENRDGNYQVNADPFGLRALGEDLGMAGGEAHPRCAMPPC